MKYYCYLMGQQSRWQQIFLNKPTIYLFSNNIEQNHVALLKKKIWWERCDIYMSIYGIFLMLVFNAFKTIAWFWGRVNNDSLLPQMIV